MMLKVEEDQEDDGEDIEPMNFRFEQIGKIEIIFSQLRKKCFSWFYPPSKLRRVYADGFPIDSSTEEIIQAFKDYKFQHEVMIVNLKFV